MRRARRIGMLFLTLIALQFGAVAGQIAASPTPAVAQAYPPDVCTVDIRVRVISTDPLRLLIRIRVICPGIVRVNIPIRIFFESERILLGELVTDATGAASGTFELPSSVRPGEHTVIADVDGIGEFTEPVTIPGDGSAAAGGTTDDIKLTGTNTAMLGAWAAALLALATALLLTGWRGARRLAPAHLGGRARRGGPPALPKPEVPFVDTSGFVPTRRHEGRPAPDTITEADVRRDGWDDGSRSDRPS